MATAVKHDPTFETPWAEFASMVRRLFRDAKKSSSLMSRQQARYLVDTYYQLQDYRIAAANQIRQSGNEPCEALDGIFTAMEACENGLKYYLGKFAATYAVGQWLQSCCGIGPVISAGLLAHLDIRKARTVGHFYSFAGLVPTIKWEKGEKRPWNASLKVLTVFKAGESFVKVQNNQNDFYGKLFAERKAIERDRNDAGHNAELAAQQLTEKKIGKTTECYKHLSNGKLPPAQIHARARRWAVKIFLSHVHEVMYRDFYGTAPPVPFSFEHCPGDHRHFIAPPNWPGDHDGKPLRELFEAEQQTQETA